VAQKRQAEIFAKAAITSAAIQLQSLFPPDNLFVSCSERTLYSRPRQPSFIEPMQVVPVAELPDGGAWGCAAKLDGYRCLAAKRGVASSSGHATGMDLPVRALGLEACTNYFRFIRVVP
jgi:hypothetical protein